MEGIKKDLEQCRGWNDTNGELAHTAALIALEWVLDILLKPFYKPTPRPAKSRRKKGKA